MSAETWLIIGIIGFSLAGVALLITVILFFKLKIPAVIGDLTGRTVAREVKAIRESNRASGNSFAVPAGLDGRKRTPSGSIAPSPQAPKLDRKVIAVAHASRRLDKSTGEILEEQRQREFDQRGRNLDIHLGNTAGKSLQESQTVPHRETAILNQNEATAILNQNEATVVLNQNEATAVLNQNEATAVLNQNEATAVLNQNEAMAVLNQNEATAILNQNEATAVLNQNEATAVLNQNDATSVLNPQETTVLEEQAPLPKTPVAASFRVVRSLERIHTQEKIE